MSDLGSKGGMAKANEFDPITSGKPRDGVDEPRKTEQMCFEPRKGFGGTNKGAH